MKAYTKRESTVQAVHAQITQLFNIAPDLINEFERFLPRSEIVLKQAIALSKIHSNVQFFLRRYMATITKRLAIIAEEGATISLTSSEAARIERAFYRFELYCNLFRREDTPHGGHAYEDDSRKDIFFDKFMPYENEQFVCIYDYLFSEVTIGKIA